MFSERLERLIQAALQDGVLTDQEKAAIIKRAQAEGEDIDEVDIYIQSLQQKRQQELNEQAQKAQTEEMVAQKKAREAASKARQEEEKERAKLLRKCPACGEPIPFGTITCPKCGHVIDLDEKNEEILELMKAIKKAAPTEFYANRSKFGYPDQNDYDKRTFDMDPILQKAFTIVSEDYILAGQYSYSVRSNYSELIAEAKVKYFGNPVFENFLAEERKRCYGLVLKCLIDEIQTAKEMADKWDINYECHKKYAEKCIDKIELEYTDIADMNLISSMKDTILELDAKSGEIETKYREIQQEKERKRQEKERKLSYKVSNFFTCIDEKVWVAIFSIVVLILIAYILK